MLKKEVKAVQVTYLMRNFEESHFDTGPKARDLPSLFLQPILQQFLCLSEVNFLANNFYGYYSMKEQLKK